MQRGYILMITGIAMQIVNWTLSSAHLVQGISGYITIIGWVIFFVGIGVRQLDKKNTPPSKKAKRK